MPHRKLKDADFGSLFRTCGKAVLRSACNEQITDSHKTNLWDGREILLGFIAELCMTGCGKDKGHKALVREVMAEVHPRTDYAYSEALIRDLAEVAGTFRRVAESGASTDNARCIVAKHLCDVMVDRFS